MFLKIQNLQMFGLKLNKYEKFSPSEVVVMVARHKINEIT